MTFSNFKFASSKPLICGLLAFAAVVHTTEDAALAQTPEQFTVVDQTVADLSPLSTSLQSLRPDFGPPQGFSRVYTSPDYPNSFLRIDGAIVVEFPHSEYIETEDGLFAELPEGAIFWIGGKPDFLKPHRPPAPEAPPSPYFVNTHVNARAVSLSEQAARERLARQPLPEPTRPTVWSDEQYRQNSLARWLSVAAQSDNL